MDTRQAIVINYVSAFLFGLWSYEQPLSASTVLNSSWLYGAILLGLLFITIFNLMAVTAQSNGLSVVSVASKMSVIIPIVLGVILYDEVLKTPQVLGIILALIAVYLVSVKKEDSAYLKKSFLFPFLVFLGSGIIDSSLKYFENYHLTKDLISIFSACIFLFAALFGSIWIFGIQKQKLSSFKGKSLLAGLVLGVVNYYSIYFLIQALKIEWLNSATVFTINNVSIVAISSITGFIIFKESISKSNFAGIFLALISIYLISNSL
ncbi:EamA family transporter [Winogradskyella aurantiaca]|uniref:EamA family transporter n=1 Tax=Winogradskyella aurantiaca TaxID=2219558 RepID=UPI001E334D95|nr:EamA family transporter [Winogradskyella aurantiaca]